MDTRIKVPQAQKAKVMLWTDVSYHDMEEIDKTQSIPDLESVLCSVFGVDLSEPKRGVLLELYVQAVLFCRERSFKKEQTSAILSIIKSVHEANVETPLNNIEQCFKYCKELLLCHSVRRPPFSINLFSSEEVTGILNYLFNSYMRHYKLYKYIFTPQVKLDLSLTYSGNPNQEEATMEESSVPSSKSGLKALIEKEVREQMMLVSGQLDQRFKEIADQHNRALESPQLNHKAKK
ncbi:cilia- and flagella-associated protein 119 [Pagrus major]|uniref:cilia- and flagella-associated protein 119 n=1 Tax=Pagrus major TaxID=143350 RepID=UPI003CC89BA5